MGDLDRGLHASLLEQLAAPERLVEFARREAARSQARGRDGLSPYAFARSVEDHAGRLSARILDGSYTFMPYRQVLASKGAGKNPREISVPSARDRGALKVILQFLQRAVPEARPMLAQSVVKQLVRAITDKRYKYFVRVDVENFYPSISHKSASAAIKRYVPEENARTLLGRAIRTPSLRNNATARGVESTRGIPQGLSISNSLAEMVMHEVDSVWGEKSNLLYFRYVDDIIVLTRRKSHRVIFRELSDGLRPLGLKCHDLSEDGSKSTWGSLSSPVDYLGYSISRDGASVKAESVARLKEKLAQRFLRYARALREPNDLPEEEWKASCLYRLKWYLDLTIAGCVLDEHRRGWIHYFSLITDLRLLRQLDYFVDKKAASAGLDFEKKSFVAAFRKAARNRQDSTGYIPDFDSFSAQEHREVLSKVFLLNHEHMSDVEVEAEFFRRLRRELVSLETDLAIAY